MPPGASLESRQQDKGIILPHCEMAVFIVKKYDRELKGHV